MKEFISTAQMLTPTKRTGHARNVCIRFVGVAATISPDWSGGAVNEKSVHEVVERGQVVSHGSIASHNVRRQLSNYACMIC